jgi:hypothetical protein
LQFNELALQSSFIGTQLPLELSRKRIEVIVLTGIHLDWCVEGNARAARDNGFKSVNVVGTVSCNSQILGLFRGAILSSDSDAIPQLFVRKIILARRVDVLPGNHRAVGRIEAGLSTYARANYFEKGTGPHPQLGLYLPLTWRLNSSHAIFGGWQKTGHRGFGPGVIRLPRSCWWQRPQHGVHLVMASRQRWRTSSSDWQVCALALLS